MPSAVTNDRFRIRIQPVRLTMRPLVVFAVLMAQQAHAQLSFAQQNIISCRNSMASDTRFVWLNGTSGAAQASMSGSENVVLSSAACTVYTITNYPKHVYAIDLGNTTAWGGQWSVGAIRRSSCAMDTHSRGSFVGSTNINKRVKITIATSNASRSAPHLHNDAPDYCSAHRSYRMPPRNGNNIVAALSNFSKHRIAQPYTALE